jgi:hypothetical protein
MTRAWLEEYNPLLSDEGYKVRQIWSAIFQEFDDADLTMRQLAYEISQAIEAYKMNEVTASAVSFWTLAKAIEQGTVPLPRTAGDDRFDRQVAYARSWLPPLISSYPLDQVLATVRDEATGFHKRQELRRRVLEAKRYADESKLRDESYDDHVERCKAIAAQQKPKLTQGEIDRLEEEHRAETRRVEVARRARNEKYRKSE